MITFFLTFGIRCIPYLNNFVRLRIFEREYEVQFQIYGKNHLYFSHTEKLRIKLNIAQEFVVQEE